MARRKFELSNEQEQELLAAYGGSKDGATRTRYQAVRLYGMGYRVSQIEEITGSCRSSLMHWCRAYLREGVRGLVDHRVGGNRAQLSGAQISELRERLRQYRPRELFGEQASSADGEFWTVEDLQRAVAKWYGVEYHSRSSYLNLLRSCDFSYQRPAKVFKSRREAEVAAFEEALEKK